MKGYRDTMGGTAMPAEHDFTRGRGNAFLWSKIVPPKIAEVLAQTQAQRASFLKNIGFAGIPLLSPGSVLGNLFASRQIFSGLSGPVGQGLLGKVGIGGTAGTVGATGVIMASLLAVGVALKALQAAIKGTIQAFEEASKLYAKSLLSGLGIQFTVHRNNLADVLGVSEKEVLQFGAAMAILGPKLRFASDTIARTTPNLTSVAWEFGILRKDLQALFFEMGNTAAPALRKFADGMGQIVNSINQFIQSSPKFVSILETFLEAAGGAITQIGKDIGPAPQPQGLMKQLPVSALERAGLVIGGFSPVSDSAQRTAKATERTAKLLEKLVGATVQGGASFGDPYMNSP